MFDNRVRDGRSGRRDVQSRLFAARGHRGRVRRPVRFVSFVLFAIRALINHLIYVSILC